MVTKTFLLEATGVGTDYADVGEVTCPEGVERRVVQVDLYYSADGTIKTLRDTEDLAEFAYNVWNGAKWPKVVDVLLRSVNKFIVQAKAATGTIDVAVEVTVEETPIV